MKIINGLSLRRILQLTGLVVVLSMIWFLSPHLAFDGQLPFASITNRILIITIIVLLLGLNALRLQLANSHTISSTQTISEKEALQQLFKNALQEFTKQSYKFLHFFRRNNRYQKPWILVMGSIGSGKSSLLQKSELNFSSHYPELRNTDLFDWWVGENAIFLDVKGKHIVPAEEQAPSNVWLYLCMLLKKYRAKKPINGVVLVINLHELLLENVERQTQQITHLKNALHSLKQKIGSHFPITIVLTKCDLLMGFNEFFADLSQEERWQLWGMVFNEEKTNLATDFNTQFNKLLQRLHDRLIWRLQHETDTKKRGMINDFPLQLEAAKNNIFEFIQKLLGDIYLTRNSQLQGIYFTSNLQHGLPLDRVTQALIPVFNIESLKLIAYTSGNKAFFTKQLLNDIILNTQIFSKQSKWAQLSWSHYIIYFLACSIVGVTLWFTVQGFRLRVDQISQAQNAIAQYQLFSSQIKQSEPQITTILTSLNTLGQVVTSLQISNRFFNLFGYRTIFELQTKAKQAYQSELKNILVPQLRLQAEQQLFNTDPHDPKQIYHALKIYLMLMDPNHVQPALLQTWLHEHWQEQGLSINYLNNIEEDLLTVLQTQTKSVVANETLIAKARTILNKLNLPQLAFVMLTDNQAEPPLKLYDGGDQAIFVGPYEKIPYIYTLAGIQSLTDEKVKAACIAATNGDWVLGTNQPVSLSALQLQTLEQDIKSLYLQVYAQVWQDVLEKTRLINVDNLNQTVVLLHQFNGNNSALMNFLRTIDENTIPLRDGSVVANLNTQSHNSSQPSLNLQLQILHVLLTSSTDQPSSQLQPILNNIAKLNDQLNAIMKTDDPNKAIYELTVNRMQHPNTDNLFLQLNLQAKQVPEPLHGWITSLTDNIWQVMLDQSHHYINDVWNITVYPDYKNYLMDKYPLKKTAVAQMSLEDFTHFFVTHGTIDTFFHNYLEPFVDTSTQTWSLREVDGKNIGISNDNLLQFQLAAFIKRMYFPNDEASLSVPFILQPISLEQSVKNFTITYNNQIFVFGRDNSNNLKLTWPASSKDTLEIAFHNTDGRFATKVENGPWALFKILDIAHVQPTDVARHFNVIFDLNGNQAKYVLIANTALSPFIPNVLNEFHCPEVL